MHPLLNMKECAENKAILVKVKCFQLISGQHHLLRLPRMFRPLVDIH